MKQKRKLIFTILLCFPMVFSLFTTKALAAQTITSNETGTHGGYDYELWKDNGTTSMTLNDGGAFSCSWSNINNALFRKGKKFNETQTHQQLGNITMDYACNYQPNGNSYLAVYGWTSDPLVEYYIIDSWGTWRPPGATSKGTFTIDGGTYDIYETTRVNQPSIKGTATFKQYWSVRTSKRTSGTISVSEHFKKWESLGMTMGKMYEVSLVVEGYQSSGQADVTNMSINIGNNNNNNNYYGDVNGDGDVNISDLILLQSFIAGEGTLANKEAADINVDGSIDIVDLINLKFILSGKLDLQPIKPTQPVTPNKLVALTFDDGPDVTLTPKVLDRLEKYKVPATFMQVGQLVNANTQAVEKRIIADGCEIGNHSWTWSSMNNMSATDVKKSVDDTNAAIQKYAGVTPKFFRAPNLATSTTMFSPIDLTFIQGITANDWSTSTTAQQRADAIINGVKDGSIILLHDVQPLPHPTPEALDIIIPKLQSEGYQFVTLSELFARKGVTLNPSDDKIYTNLP